MVKNAPATTTMTAAATPARQPLLNQPVVRLLLVAEGTSAG
jgi:hypothetical protein